MIYRNLRSFMELVEATACWEKLKTQVREQLGAIRYGTWFDGTSILSATEKELVVVAKDRFHANYLHNRYGDILYNITPIHFGINFKEVTVLAPEDVEMWKRKKDQMSIPENYTFENFIVGNSNLLAHAASLAVAESPGTDYNPLFIYGGPGLGKTHLLTAIANYVMDEHKDFIIEYSNAEKFTNEVVEAIREKRTQELRERLRHTDMLFIDDIQFLAGRTTTQEEFFNTFNELYTHGKQIVISSDRPPDEIDKLEERMRSRFKSGVVVAIDKPDLETRIAILRSKATTLNLSAEDDALELLAQEVDTNIRELEGSLSKAQLIARVHREPVITIDVAAEALSDIVTAREEKKEVTPELIIKLVAQHYHIAEADILSQGRSRDIAVPRQLAIYLTREKCGFSTPRIGQAFGRDHSTVMHACKKAEEMIKSDPVFAMAVRSIESALGS